MNGKKAKQLHKQAREETVGKPKKAYLAERPHVKRFAATQPTGEPTVVGMKVATYRLHPESTQGRLRQLKKENRHAR